MLCTTPKVVVMKIHDRVIGSRTGLWGVMMLSAGVLAVLLACAGAAVDAASGTNA